MTKLTIDDIADLRAYERERPDFQRQVIDLKKRRRVHLGDFLTLAIGAITGIEAEVGLAS